MSKSVETVESPTSPFVILKFFIVTVDFIGLSDKIVNPVKEDS